MRKFDSDEEGCAESFTDPGERLEQFSQALWKLLEPSHDSPSIQARLVHANSAIYLEFMRNGGGNYYELYDEGPTRFGENGYSRLLVFMLDTLVANRSSANRDVDVDYFRELRKTSVADWNRKRSSTKGDELEAEEPEPSFDFEEMYDRAVRCVANWCIANPDLIDDEGAPLANAPSLRTLSEGT
jgi:hypothetical protein